MFWKRFSNRDEKVLSDWLMKIDCFDTILSQTTINRMLSWKLRKKKLASKNPGIIVTGKCLLNPCLVVYIAEHLGELVDVFLQLHGRHLILNSTPKIFLIPAFLWNPNAIHSKMAEISERRKQNKSVNVTPLDVALFG
jgi:hypothetical protein